MLTLNDVLAKIPLSMRALAVASTVSIAGCASLDSYTQLSKENIRNPAGHVIGHKIVKQNTRTGEIEPTLVTYTPVLNAQGNVARYDEPTGYGAIHHTIDGRVIGNTVRDLRSRGALTLIVQPDSIRPPQKRTPSIITAIDTVVVKPTSEKPAENYVAATPKPASDPISTSTPAPMKPAVESPREYAPSLAVQPPISPAIAQLAKPVASSSQYRLDAMVREAESSMKIEAEKDYAALIQRKEAYATAIKKSAVESDADGIRQRDAYITAEKFRLSQIAKERAVTEAKAAELARQEAARLTLETDAKAEQARIAKLAQDEAARQKIIQEKLQREAAEKLAQERAALLAIQQAPAKTPLATESTYNPRPSSAYATPAEVRIGRTTIVPAPSETALPPTQSQTITQITPKPQPQEYAAVASPQQKIPSELKGTIYVFYTGLTAQGTMVNVGNNSPLLLSSQGAETLRATLENSKYAKLIGNPISVPSDHRQLWNDQSKFSLYGKQDSSSILNSLCKDQNNSSNPHKQLCDAVNATTPLMLRLTYASLVK